MAGGVLLLRLRPPADASAQTAVPASSASPSSASPVTRAVRRSPRSLSDRSNVKASESLSVAYSWKTSLGLPCEGKALLPLRSEAVQPVKKALSLVRFCDLQEPQPTRREPHTENPHAHISALRP